MTFSQHLFNATMARNRCIATEIVTDKEWYARCDAVGVARYYAGYRSKAKYYAGYRYRASRPQLIRAA